MFTLKEDHHIYYKIIKINKNKKSLLACDILRFISYHAYESKDIFGGMPLSFVISNFQQVNVD